MVHHESQQTCCQSKRTKHPVEAVAEGLDEVAVHLHRRAPRQQRLVVAAQRQTLPVAVPGLVGVEDVRVLLTDPRLQAASCRGSVPMKATAGC